MRPVGWPCARARLTFAFNASCKERGISDRGFAQARDKLAWTCLEHLNTFVLKTADTLGLIPRWHGLRLVLGLGCLATLLEKTFELLGGNSHRQVPDRRQS